MSVTLLLLLLQVTLAIGSAYNALLEDLFAGYNSNGRPTDNASYPTLVRMEVKMTNLIELVRQFKVQIAYFCRFAERRHGDIDYCTVSDNGRQRCVEGLRVILLQSWNDHNLKWSPDAYNGIKVMSVKLKNIWKPDIIGYEQ